MKTHAEGKDNAGGRVKKAKLEKVAFNKFG